MTHLCWHLMLFEAISGLKINLDKSELFLVGMRDDPEELSAEIGCKVGSLPPFIWVTHWVLPLSRWWLRME